MDGIMKTMVKILAGLIVLLILLTTALFIYTRFAGPVALPLALVYKLAEWESHKDILWEGRGTVIAYMDKSDLVPGGDRVTVKPPFRSDILEGDRALLVYLPEGYDEKRKRPYPVLFALHGFGDRCNNWVASLLPVLEKAIEAGTMPPVVVIMPDFSLTGNGTDRDSLPATGKSGSWYVNSNLGRYEDHFFEEIVPFARKNFNVRRDRAGTALYGNSMGGYGAVFYSMKRPGFARIVGALYPMLDLRYAVNGKRLAEYDPARYEPITTDKPKRVVMDGGIMGMLGVGEDFFFYPVFADVGPENLWHDDTPLWERMKSVNPADMLRSGGPDLSGIRYYMIAGGSDEFNFEDHLKLVRPMLEDAGAKVFPEDYIIPGMKHGWWQKENNIHKKQIVEWLGSMIRE